MWAKISCSTHCCFWALPSCAYWTGISVTPENWLSSAGTGVEPTDMRQLRATAYLCSETDIQLLLVAVLNWRCTWCSPRVKGGDELQTRVPEPDRLKLDVSVEVRPDLDDCAFLRRRVNVSWASLPFFSRSVGVCEYSYMLMNPVLLFCSTFMFIPAFSSWDACRHAPRSSPVSSLCLCRQRPDWD